MKLNVGCGPWRAPEPWINLDVHRGDGVEPDILVDDAARPCAGFADGSATHVYLGHVLEHVPWDELPGFLADIARVLEPGGQVCVVGPDVIRTIEGWRAGRESWELVVSTLEGPDYFPADGGHVMVDPGGGWRYARHWWNCTEGRVAKLLADHGFAEVTPIALEPESLAGWPVVGYAPWQCAVRAVKA